VTRTEQPSDADPRQRLVASIAALRERFREVTLARAAEVEAAALAQVSGSLANEQRASAERAAHKLAGSLGTYGYPAGSRIAREIEVMLGGVSPLDAAETLRLSDLAVALQQELERNPDQTPADVAPGAARPQLWVRSRDDDFVARLLMEAAGRGVAAARVRGAALAGAAEAEAARQVIVFDLAGELESELADLWRLARQGAGSSLLVVAEAPPLAARLAAGRLRTRAFLEKPVSPLRVMDAVESLLREQPASGSRVAGHIGDPEDAAAVASALHSHGLHAFLASDAYGLWGLLETQRPDAVILDLATAADGLAICRALRADPRWGWVVLIALAEDPESLESALEAGADEVMLRPVRPEALVRRLESRLERMAALSAAAASDPLTGLWQRTRLDEGVSQLVRLAERHGEPLALAVVALDDLPGLNDRWGPASGDHAMRVLAGLLRQSLRAEDVVGRSAGGEFVLAMYPARAEDAVLRLTGVLERFTEQVERTSADGIHCTASAGVAEMPRDGNDPAALRESAVAAVARAARGQIALAGRREPSPGAHDVVVVEDDETIAGLLLHTLDARGYDAEWIADGAAALESLAGDDPRMRGRVILLDVDLPGRDGLTVLRALARDGVLEQSRVIMLTVRAGEREVIKAMEAGAFDHVAKPFSPQVLVHRIERALRSL